MQTTTTMERRTTKKLYFIYTKHYGIALWTNKKGVFIVESSLSDTQIGDMDIVLKHCFVMFAFFYSYLMFKLCVFLCMFFVLFFNQTNRNNEPNE